VDPDGRDAADLSPPGVGFFTEFSQAPGMSEAVAFEQAMAEMTAI
jgi:hypothetical protein